MSPVPSVIGDCIPGEKSSHDCGNGDRAGSQQKVHMGGKESPSVADG